MLMLMCHWLYVFSNKRKSILCTSCAEKKISLTKTIFGTKLKFLVFTLYILWNYWILQPAWSILCSPYNDKALNLGLVSAEFFCLTKWSSSDTFFTNYVFSRFFLYLSSPKDTVWNSSFSKSWLNVSNDHSTNFF